MSVAIVTQGDARRLLLPENSVDLIVTSPPFLNLRSYQDGGAHMAEQIGTGTRDEFLAQLWEATAEMKRVLKPTGSIFVELGDSYTDKCLNMTPHRYAIGCVDQLGLMKRAEIVWSRPNGLPESVTDRVRRSHSVVFHFVKQPRYYSALDEVREAHLSPVTAGRRHNGAAFGAIKSGGDGSRHTDGHPLGKLPGSVWEIATSPLTAPLWRGVERGRVVRYFAGTPDRARAEADAWLRRGGAIRRSVRPMAAHFAAFPPELVRRIVLGWSPREVCTACGEGRQPVKATTLTVDRGGRTSQRLSSAVAGGPPGSLGRERFVTVTGYACACPDTTAPSTPGVVLDPFGGTGTTALVASCFGRVGISVDLSADYCRLARWRTTDPGERARVLGVDKPPVQVDGQLGLFEGGAA